MDVSIEYYKKIPTEKDKKKNQQEKKQDRKAMFNLDGKNNKGFNKNHNKFNNK